MRKNVFPFLLLLGFIKVQAQQTNWLESTHREPSDACKFIANDSKQNIYSVSEHSGGGSSGSGYSYYTFEKYDKWRTLRWGLQFQGWGFTINGITLLEDAPVLYGDHWAPINILGYNSPTQTGCVIAKFNANGGICGGKYITASAGRNCMAERKGNLYYFGYHSGLFVLGNDTLVNTGIPGGILLKLDSSLHTVWHKEIQLSTHYTWSLLQVKNDRIIVIATYNNTVQADQFALTPDTGAAGSFMLSVDQEGNTLWLKNVVNNTPVELSYAAAVDDDDNIYVSAGYGEAHYLSKHDKSGKTVWQHTTPALYWTLGYSERQLVAGVWDTANGNKFISVMDTSGTVIKEFHHTNVRPWFVKRVGNADYQAAGALYPNCSLIEFILDTNCHPQLCNSSDSFLFEFSDTSQTAISSISPSNFDIQVAPNPSRIFDLSVSTPLIGSACEVTNVLGVTVKTFIITKRPQVIDLTEVPKGIYYLRFAHNATVPCRKLVVE